jgi:hypothetical protein
MLSEKQKEIYNLYLKALAYGANRPYKKREDFSTFKNEENALYLARLEAFFEKFPQLYREEFFLAPYKLYDEKKQYYTLKFYASHKGLTTCLAYFKTLQESDPDAQLDYVKESIRFIANFCIEKNIPLEMYSTFKSVAQPDFLLHLKDHKVSFYAIFGITGLYYELLNLPEDEFELYFGEDLDITELMQRYHSSRVVKPFLVERVPKVSQYIRNNLKQVAC